MATASPPRTRAATPSLRREFARLLLLLVVPTALVLSLLALWQGAQTRRLQVAQRMDLVTEAAARELDAFLQVHLAAVQVLANRRSDGPSADVATWRADLARLRRFYPGFVSLLATDAQGRVRATAPVSSRAMPSTADREYFQVPARTGAAHVSNAFRGRALGNDPLVAVSAPMLRGGRFDGVVQGSIRIDTFAAMRSLKMDERGMELLLVDRLGRVVHATPGLPMRSLDALSAHRANAALATLDDPRVSRSAAPIQGLLRTGEAAYVAVAPLRIGWRAYVLLPKQAVDDEFRNDVVALGVLLMVLLAGVVGIAFHQSLRLVQSVDHLLEPMQRFALDEDSAPIETAALPKELVPLAAALNQLGARTRHAYRALSLGLAEQEALRISLEKAISERELEIAQRTDELRRAVAELDRLSSTDPLTGCLNRRGFDEAVAALRGVAHYDAPLGVLALDIDLFKPFNDRYGHPAGDAALRRIAGAIRSALRDGRDVLARVGGEEFLVVLPDDDQAQAHVVAERIRLAVRTVAIPHADAPDGIMTVSIGVSAATPGDGYAVEPALQRADAALYRAKHAGRDRVAD